MIWTVFLTVVSGVITYVLGELILKLFVEPVHETKRTIGQISHSLIEYASVIANPGVRSKEVLEEVSRSLRRLSSQLHAHLRLVPLYGATAFVFRLPSRTEILAASTALIGLSNGVFERGFEEQNADRVRIMCESLGIYRPEADRAPEEPSSR